MSAGGALPGGPRRRDVLAGLAGLTGLTGLAAAAGAALPLRVTSCT
ncbi:hypothetical protein GTR00_19265, partial [Kineococcus sp. T90]|nr:hypothetical protein [Kineococcus indalonis]